MSTSEQSLTSELLPPQNVEPAANSVVITNPLKPYAWQPGQSGNPSGRPKGILTEAYKRRLAELGPTGKQVAAEIADAITAKAAKGDVAAASELADRTEGKPMQQSQVEFSLIAPTGLAQYDPDEE